MLLLASSILPIPEAILLPKTCQGLFIENKAFNRDNLQTENPGIVPGAAMSGRLWCEVSAFLDNVFSISVYAAFLVSPLAGVHRLYWSSATCATCWPKLRTSGEGLNP